ncbi:MAG TPA: cytochrome c [Candidatus Acidoferrales bacterium]
MKRLLLGSIFVTSLSLGGIAALSGTTATRAPDAAPVTFYKDVLPILQNNCQSCHRAGEVAPMALLTYEQTRPWAAGIKTAVLTKKMPPWFADPRYGHFSNERRLTPEQIKTLVSWVDSGAAAGDPKDGPAPLKFVDGWNIGMPDKVIEMPNEFQVPEQGVIDYQYDVIPGDFKEDTWVTAAEIRPGNRAVVHHVIAYVRPPGSPWLKDAKPGVPFPLPKITGQARGDGARQGQGGAIFGAEHLVGFAPGMQPLLLDDSAKLVKAGSDIVLQLHYTTNGKSATDKTRIGLVFAKTPPKYRNVTLLAPNRNFVIPPNDDNYEVKSQVELQDTVTLVDLVPHMHFRGKDFLYKVVYPSGQTETLLFVPKYDFNWQLGYLLAQPLVLPKGTRIECTAHFDNSPNNPYNPDPTKEVRWGDQTWEEMMIGWFQVTVDPKVSTAGLVRMLPGSAKASIATPPPPATQQ